jgi:tetratricopeptide (TPR) repeat protein
MKGRTGTRARRALAGWLIACALGVMVGPASAQDGVARAQMLDVEASGLFRAGQHRAALSRFQAAYEAHPNPTSAWNIARCYEELRLPPQAISAFKLYMTLEGLSEADLAEARAHIDARERELDAWREATQEALALERDGDTQGARAAWERALSLHADADTRCRVGLALLALDRRSPAREQLTLALEDEALAAPLRVRAQEALAALDRPPEVTPQIKPEVKSEVRPEIKPDPTPAPEVASWPGWVMVGGAAASLLGGAWLVVQYRNDLDRLEVISKTPGALEEYRALNQTLDREELGMVVTFGLSAALLGGALWWWSQDDAPVEGAALRLLLGPGELGVQGRF